MRKKIFFVFIILIPKIFYGQGINNNWLSGYSSWGGLPYGQNRMDFTNGIPLITYDSIEMDFEHTHANISDISGNMIFYTNGYYIADSNNDTMQNGSGINPSAYTSSASEGLFIPQSHLIVNRPLSDSIYDMFHCTWDNWPTSSGVLSFYLYHSVIDKSLNSGLGAVILKNQIIISDSLVPGRIIACKHANGRDWWIVCMKAYSNKFYQFILSPSGLSPALSQNIGLIRNPWYYGQAKFSPNGKKLAIYNPGLTAACRLEVFDFDRCSGQLSNPFSITFPAISVFNCGVEFSPNSELLYITTGDFIFQYDLTSPNIANSKDTVAVQDTFYQPGFPGLTTGLCLTQLAQDGKIYITTGNSTSYFGTIDNPDIIGIGCNVSQHSVLLPAYNYNTLPNHPNYFLGCDTTCTTCLVGVTEQTTEIKNARAAPNPNNGVFTLQFAVQSTSGELEIYDVMGNLVLRDYVAAWSQYKRVDIMQLANGVYFCRLKWKDSTLSIKVIKE